VLSRILSSCEDNASSSRSLGLTFNKLSKPLQTAASHLGSQGLLHLPGLRVVIFVLAGAMIVTTLAAYFFHPMMDPGLGAGSEEASNLPTTFLAILGLMIPVEVVAFWAVRKGLRKQLRQALSDGNYQRGDSLPPTFVTICIIGAAMTSGIGYFAAVILLLTGSLIALAIAFAASVLILLQVPKDDSLRGV
jgi:divalent metal cation (Fe/Co/Zn/Cd) transporter